MNEIIKRGRGRPKMTEAEKEKTKKARLERKNEVIKRGRGRPKKTEAEKEKTKKARFERKKREKLLKLSRQPKLIKANPKDPRVRSERWNGRPMKEKTIQEVLPFDLKDGYTKIPPLPIVWNTVFEALKMQCTEKEVAALFLIPVETLRLKIKDRFGMTFIALKDIYSELGKKNLRRTQIELSSKSAAMAIHLGKHWLGQRDVIETINTTEITQKAILELPDNGRRVIKQDPVIEIEVKEDVSTSL